MSSSVETRRDEELLADHLSGRAGAFDALVSRYLDALYAFFFRLVRSSAAADDLVQETFLQVHVAAGQFDTARTFKPWLFTIAANKARDYLRSRGRRQAQSLDAGSTNDESASAPAERVADGATSVPEDAVTIEQAERVRGVIANMPEHLRMILVLGYYQRLPYAEIAEVLGIPVGTVKSRLHSAVSHFAEAWKRLEAGSPAGADETE